MLAYAGVPYGDGLYGYSEDEDASLKRAAYCG